jgi:hypothetical protein
VSEATHDSVRVAARVAAEELVERLDGESEVPPAATAASLVESHRMCCPVDRHLLRLSLRQAEQPA